MAILLTKHIDASIKPILEDHFLTLPLGDRQKRFGYAISDYQIKKFINAEMENVNNVWILAHDIRMLDTKVVGVTQLCLNRKTNVSEIGVSVAREAQGEGVGTKMVESAFRTARLFQAKKVYALTMSNNKSIQHILKKKGIEFVSLGSGEIEGSVDMEHTLDEYFQDTVNMLLAFYKFNLDYQFNLYDCLTGGKCHLPRHA